MEPVSVTHARLIEDWVVEILQQYEQVAGRTLSLPIPIFDIAERLFALRCDAEDLRSGLANASGLLIPRKRWIILNKRQSPQRLRFTLAHELAHWLINHQDLRQGDHSLEQITGLRFGDDFERERRADYVAGALLVPKRLLIDEASRLGAISEKEVSELAVRFDVSESAIRVRLKQLNHHLNDLRIQRLPADDDQRKSAGHQSGTSDNSLRGSKAAIVRVDGPIIDHNLYRRLLSLKRSCGHLYVVLSSKDSGGNDVFADFDCVDGFAVLENEQFEGLEKEDPANSGQDMTLCTIVSGKWLERLVQDDWGRREGGDGVSVVTLRQDDRYDVKQRVLLDVSRFVEPLARLKYRQDAKLFVRNAKESGKRVVIATGCFDLLTKYHVRFLKRAKEVGDVLVVGIEDDTRVRAFKGLLRPVNTISQRVEVVDALEFVDFTFVICGSPKSPLKPFYARLHKTIGADILAVTDGDPYLEDRRDEVEAAGGKLVVVNRYEDGSSTSLLRRFLSEIEYSDLLLVSKQKLRDYVAEHQTDWRQLKLPLGDFR